MIRSLRAGLALAAVALADASTASRLGDRPAAPAEASAATRPLQAMPKLAPGQWPQAKSDVARRSRHPLRRPAQRHALRHQAPGDPPGQAALRLRFDAGSLMETDAQQGLAHFLEHMAFNGSKAVPEGEMVKILERHGLAFGADTNASTDFDETIYKLDLPQDRRRHRRHLADAAARGGPRADHRPRPPSTASAAWCCRRSAPATARPTGSSRRGWTSCCPASGCRPAMPIGKVDILQNAPASLIADFYHHYYRPERAMLVAVGDFDPAAMEAKIKADN